VLLGTPDVSSFFILGLVQAADPAHATSEMENLRQALLQDPYFKDVPSMQPAARKTALAFHAKDDVPEVRREVFGLLTKLDFKFSVVVKTMSKVLEYVRSRNEMDSDYRYTPSELYDLTVRMLFRQRLHRHQEYRIFFAQRGRKDRSRALRVQLESAREKFLAKAGKSAASRIEVQPAYPWEQPCLQIADYCLWAVQRLYSAEEDRYLSLLWPKLSLLHDVDDISQTAYGVYHTRNNPPLTVAGLKNRQV